MTAGRTRPERLYRALLGLYPADYRERYADQMTQLFSDQLRDARAEGRAATTAGTWLRAVPDVVGSAISEHRDGRRRFGHTLESPSGLNRFLGLAGIVGGALLTLGIVMSLDGPVGFARGWLYPLGVIAVVLAVHRRQAVTAGPVERAITVATVGMFAWFIAMGIASTGNAHPFAGDFGFVYFLASVAIWAASTVFGLVTFRLRRVSRLGAATLAVSSVMAVSGIDRLGLVHGTFEWLIAPLALTGLALNGLAWVALGLDVALRRRPRHVAVIAS